jgi:hypothetical protein
VARENRAEMNEEVAKGERRDPKAPPTERTTWIQCENGACGKWRRVPLSEVPEGAWFCHQNSDTRSLALFPLPSSISFPLCIWFSPYLRFLG